MIYRVEVRTDVEAESNEEVVLKANALAERVGGEVTEILRRKLGGGRMTQTNLKRLERLVDTDLSGSFLVHATKVEEDDTEAFYVVLVKRAQHPFEDRPFATHRACVSLKDDRAMLVSGHYDLDLFEAVEDYLKRTGAM